MKRRKHAAERATDYAQRVAGWLSSMACYFIRPSAASSTQHTHTQMHSVVAAAAAEKLKTKTIAACKPVSKPDIRYNHSHICVYIHMNVHICLVLTVCSCGRTDPTNVQYMHNAQTDGCCSVVSGSNNDNASWKQLTSDMTTIF